MSKRQPSRTAIVAAGFRAAHQTLDGGRIFSDPHALTILGAHRQTILNGLTLIEAQTSMRIFMAARSRFAEDRLGVAVAQGVRQAVILGAGLDTFSIRNPYYALGLQVFEVDHPATQAWKRERLAEVGLTPSPSTVFVGIDFETQPLGPALVDAGVAPLAPVFFVWLGVVPYLQHEAIVATLDFIASLPGSEVVFDYSEPLENFPLDRRLEIQELAARAKDIGEPWLSYFDPEAISDLMRKSGFDVVEDLGPKEIAIKYRDTSGMQTDFGPGGHILHARTAC